MRVRRRSGLDGPVGGFLEPVQAHQRHGACTERADEQRVERAQPARMIGRRDGGLRIAGLPVETCAALQSGAQAALQQDILALIERFNPAVDGTKAVPSEYLEIVIIRD